jgi:hypothetical protein
MNWKGCGRKRSWPNLRYCPCTSREGITETTKCLSEDSRCLTQPYGMKCAVQWSLGIRIPGWSGQFWANHSPVFSIEIMITAYYYYYYYVILGSALSDDFFVCHLYHGFSPRCFGLRVIRTTPPPYSPDDRGTTLL